MSILDSTRDQILEAMSQIGWSNEADGDVTAPTGYFTRISNTREEMNEIIGLDTVRDVIRSQGHEVSDDFPVPITTYRVSDLVGHFLIVENDQGFVEVFEYERERDLLDAYRELEHEYSRWLEGEDY